AFVPLEPSEFVEDVLRVPFDRALIKGAPDFGVGRHLSPEQELQLYRHYGLDSPPPEGSAPDRDFGRLAGQEE
ncbi:PRC-barrel domain containing protein, partial [Streptomyces sp. SID7499]|nr:PRC-barrel domain containing protein [Streptomyces sp. SID7499]